jgi:hypothetical protein
LAVVPAMTTFASHPGNGKDPASLQGLAIMDGRTPSLNCGEHFPPPSLYAASQCLIYASSLFTMVWKVNHCSLKEAVHYTRRTLPSKPSDLVNCSSGPLYRIHNGRLHRHCFIHDAKKVVYKNTIGTLTM